MNEKHYKEKLSAFVNHELAHDERQAIAEHLLLCADCRAEHDKIKFAARLAGELRQTDAPAHLWKRIENSLDGKNETVSAFPKFAVFNLRGLTAAAALFVFCGLLTVIYFGFFKQNNSSTEIVKNETPVQSANNETPQIAANSQEIVPFQNANRTVEPKTENLTLPDAKPVNQPQTSAPIPKELLKSAPVRTKETAPPMKLNLPSWKIETLAGTPRAGNQTIAGNGKLAVGEFLETDANSRARVEVADIGNVEIAPNSRVQLVNTNPNEHRLSLKKGLLQAKINAPPRLFIVDTPSAVAVDLGCEYTLEVDTQGNSRLHVTSGFVALENGKFESIVPAGAIAVTRKGKGVGTPFAEDASAEFQAALFKLDFENGGREALRTIIENSTLYDSITLWHLLSRVEKMEREQVFDALAAKVKPPANVTREGILRLDKKMLADWWKEIEKVWFE